MSRARKTKFVTLRVRHSFNGMYAGDTATVELNERVQGWINAHVVEVIDTGAEVTDSAESETGPGGPEQGDPQRLQGGADGGRETRPEQGEDPRSG